MSPSVQNKWYTQRGIDDDIVIASRITLQRNLYDYTFPPKMTDGEAMRVIDEINRAFFGDDPYLNHRYHLVRLDQMKDRGRLFWVQRHILKKSALAPKFPEALILSDDEASSLWMNSGNHLQIQGIRRGFQIGQLYESVSALDRMLESRLRYAYSEKYGYLTTSAADMGTGMHVTFYMHLPFLESLGMLHELRSRISAQGFTVTIAEDIQTGAAGHIFEVTNKQTLGLSERDLLDRAVAVEELLVKRERETKTMVLAQGRLGYEDNIYKAYGMLRYARKLSITEATEYLSFLDQGIQDRSIMLDGTLDVFPLLMDIQSENLALVFSDEWQAAGSTLSEEARALQVDMYRASYIRERLPELI